MKKTDKTANPLTALNRISWPFVLFLVLVALMIFILTASIPLVTSGENPVRGMVQLGLGSCCCGLLWGTQLK
jgi:hypothetical protein